MKFVATCARGTEQILREELHREGVKHTPQAGSRAGVVAFEGGLEDAYRVCMWSRVASRVLMPIARFAAFASDADGLYEQAKTIPWSEHFHVDDTFAVDCVVSGDRRANTRYLALKIKDAIADRFRSETGRRPDVDVRTPDVRVHVYIFETETEGEATLSIDLSGEALHRRGYRPRNAPAPLKETLAAAMIRLAGFTRDTPVLIDPLCGTGTLLVEAAMIAGDVAPGLTRRRWGFTHWLGHDERAYRLVLAEAQARSRDGDARCEIVGRDIDESAVRLAQQSAQRAGVDRFIRVVRGELRDAAPPGGEPGLLVTNPPYGERLGDARSLFRLYETLGDVLKQRFGGYEAWVLAGDPALAKRIGLKAASRTPLWNGPIECRLLQFPIVAKVAPPPGAETSSGDSAAPQGPGWRKPSPEASMFDNRIKKNLRSYNKWLKQEQTGAYRLYDADIPEYNVAVDVYDTIDDGRHVLVHEYSPPRSIKPAVAERRLRDVLMLVPDRLECDEAKVHLRVRSRKRGGAQYERRGDEGAPKAAHVMEGGLRFEVNFEDYLDTGLFMDMRALRGRMRDEAKGKDVLNLFAYTCTASVYVAAGGAREVVSVDLSRPYLAWGERLFRDNGLDPRAHRFERADCLRWLRQHRDDYDMILLNPPSYSRSKSMEGDFDIVRDHVELIRDTMALLRDSGTLYFVTHARGFELDPEVQKRTQAVEISSDTVPKDFARSPHRAFAIRRK